MTIEIYYYTGYQEQIGSTCVQVEDVILSRKVLYHFAIFVVVNAILIFKDRSNKGVSVRPIKII